MHAPVYLSGRVVPGEAGAAPIRYGSDPWGGD